MQRKNLLKSACEKAKKKIPLAKNINNWYIVNCKIVLMEFLCNMKKMYKENKAITIVGLVIIILVLLIITGMTIAILIGNSGIIEQARKAKNNTQEALENEKEILDKLTKITGEKLNENEEENSTKGNAKEIRENAKNTYGKEVSNYIVKDAKEKEIQADKDVKWKIFYASDENVYLISDSYVKNTALPYSRTLNEDGMTVATENTPNKFTGDDPNCLNGKQYRAHFLNVVNSYSGMDRILANKTYGNSLKNMNSKYFNTFFERRNNKIK